MSRSEVLNHPLVQAVRDLAQIEGGQAYLVGGAVRDWLLADALPLDLDFTLMDCRAERLAAQLAERENGRLVPLDPVFGIHRVVFADGLTVDLSEALENSLEVDLARRDLTINAMAMDPQSGVLIDPFSGQADLERRTIRMVSEINLVDDPLRLLRVFRFMAQIGAERIDAATLEAVKRHGPKLWESAAERIQYELFRLLSVERSFPAVQAMADSGLLEVVLPEMAPMRAIASSGFHHLGLFEHSLELVRQAERLLPEVPEKTQATMRQPFSNAVTRFGLVKLACLLHDIGKPATKGTRPDPVFGERLTFYGHEEVGEQMADPLLRRLKVSNDVRDYIKKLIRWHLYPCQFGPDSPRKSILRFYRRMGDETPDVLLLALADRHSATGPWLNAEELATSHQARIWLMENFEAEQAVLKTPRLLNGHEVMETLGLGPGPHLKDMLEALEEVQQLGEVTTPDEARSWLIAQYAPRGV